MAWTIDELEEHLLIGSTLVEGSTLTEGEARAVLAGRTVVGHALFADRNGRIGRVLLAYYLHRERGLGFRFYARDKLEHLRAIEATDHGERDPLVAFISARIVR